MAATNEKTFNVPTEDGWTISYTAPVDENGKVQLPTEVTPSEPAPLKVTMTKKGAFRSWDYLVAVEQENGEIKFDKYPVKYLNDRGAERMVDDAWENDQEKAAETDHARKAAAQFAKEWKAAHPEAAPAPPPPPPAPPLSTDFAQQLANAATKNGHTPTVVVSTNNKSVGFTFDNPADSAEFYQKLTAATTSVNNDNALLGTTAGDSQVAIVNGAALNALPDADRQQILAKLKDAYRQPVPSPVAATPANPDDATKAFAQKMAEAAKNEFGTPGVNYDADKKNFVFSFSNAHDAADFAAKVKLSQKLTAETAQDEQGDAAKDIAVPADAIAAVAKLSESDKAAVLSHITPPVDHTPDNPVGPAMAEAPAAKPHPHRRHHATHSQHPHQRHRHHHRHVMGCEHAEHTHREHAQGVTPTQDGNPYRDAIPGEYVRVYDGVRGGHSEYRGPAPLTAPDGTVLNPNSSSGHYMHHRSRIETPVATDEGKAKQKHHHKKAAAPESCPGQ